MKSCPQCGQEYGDTTTLCPSDGAVLEKDTVDGLVGQTLADKYRVEELINQGGMGAVYRGTHILMDKTVAIKVLHPALAADEKIVARFSREARAASRISHPHALNVTDFGESSNGVVFLVMEYLNGKTLKEVIANDNPLPLPRVVEIMRQVTGALEAAHHEGVVHRDLKSDNIMLMDAGNGADWAKVLDFGIAKIQEPMGQDPALTSPNLIIGTPQYMSPEQCSQASEIDARTDIYSLGIILYEMLSGHVPFTGESPTAIMMKHLQDAPPSILEERKDLPAAVGRVLARALAKRPEDRFQNVTELGDALAQSALNEPIAATTNAEAARPERSTNRIVVPTGQNTPPRTTTNDEHDEATVVSARPTPPDFVVLPPQREYAPPPDNNLNIWKIAIPAIVALVVVFGVVYALTQNKNEPANNQNSAPLSVDQNGQPVQPLQPATGQGEQGINSTTPIVTPSLPATVATTPASNSNLNRNSQAIPSASVENANENAAANDNAENQNSEPKPSPSNTGGNSNRRALPPPQVSPSKDDDADEPPPLPTPKKDRPLPPPAEPASAPPQNAQPDSSLPRNF
jgi:serine/threonine-protein kinase